MACSCSPWHGAMPSEHNNVKKCARRALAAAWVRPNCLIHAVPRSCDGESHTSRKNNLGRLASRSRRYSTPDEEAMGLLKIITAPLRDSAATSKAVRSLQVCLV